MTAALNCATLWMQGQGASSPLRTRPSAPPAIEIEILHLVGAWGLT